MLLNNVLVQNVKLTLKGGNYKDKANKNYDNVWFLISLIFLNNYLSKPYIIFFDYQVKFK